MSWQLCIRGGVKAKVKVVTVHHFCSLVNQLTGSYQPCWAFSELLRFGSFESLISGSKMKWRWGLLQCGPGLRRWESKLATQDCLVTREYLLWIWTWLILQYYYPLILLCLIHSNLTAESGCSISLSSSGRGREGHRRERNGETLGNHHHSMELRKWKVSFVMDNGMEQWCLMIDLIMKREYCKIKANVDC